MPEIPLCLTATNGSRINLFLLEGIYQKSASEMTQDELKRKEADKEYFQSERDRNKDGFLDTVSKLLMLFCVFFVFLL